MYKSIQMTQDIAERETVELTHDGMFKIINVWYSKQMFGNSGIDLISRTGLQVSIGCDKAIYFECRIYKDSFENRPFIENVYESIGLLMPIIPKDYLEAIKVYCKTIRENLNVLDEAFNEENIKSTLEKAKAIGLKKFEIFMSRGRSS